jgi:E-phenylitaconyl-CoA hydratase
VPDVLYERRRHLAIIMLNRPEALNALNAPVRRGLFDAFTSFRDDADAWVAIVTGAGDRAFSAGADLKEMSAGRQAELSGEFSDPFWEAERPALNRGLPIWKPIIAAINGYCLAGGLELALACDIRIAVPEARFGLTEVLRGIIPGGGGTQRLPRIVPFGIALQLMFTGEHIDAAEAHRIGLVNRVVPAADLMAEAEALAERICANAPLSTRAIKEAAYRGINATLEDGLRIESFLSRIIRTTDDSREGPRAFAEKRPAAFKGR